MYNNEKKFKTKVFISDIWQKISLFFIFFGIFGIAFSVVLYFINEKFTAYFIFALCLILILIYLILPKFIYSVKIEHDGITFTSNTPAEPNIEKIKKCKVKYSEIEKVEFISKTLGKIEIEDKFLNNIYKFHLKIILKDNSIKYFVLDQYSNKKVEAIVNIINKGLLDCGNTSLIDTNYVLSTIENN